MGQRDSLVLYVKEEIKKRIENGELLPGMKLPSEPQLAREFNVSRSVLRESLKILEREGILKSKNGIGTFISNDAKEFLYSFVNRLISMGELIGSFGFKDIQGDMLIYESDPDENEWRVIWPTTKRYTVIERVRMANDKNVSFSVHIFPKEIAKDYFNTTFNGSLLNFLEKVMNIKVDYAISEICAPENSIYFEKAKKHLSSNIILFKQLHFDKADHPIFYSYDFLDNSIIKLFVKRKKW